MDQQNNPNSCPPPYPDSVFSPGPSGKSRGVAALLAIFLGSLGIQYFYLGKNTACDNHIDSDILPLWYSLDIMAYTGYPNVHNVTAGF